MGRLTMSVVDTAHGYPAAGMIVEVWTVSDQGKRSRLKTVITNSQGRSDKALVGPDKFGIGVYEMVFLIGDYFDGIEHIPEFPRFLDRVPVRIGVADPEADYHVALLTSRWGYTISREF